MEIAPFGHVNPEFEKYDGSRLEILRVLAESNELLTPRAIAENDEVSVGQRQVTNVLKDLKKEGVVECVEAGQATVWSLAQRDPRPSDIREELERFDTDELEYISAYLANRLEEIRVDANAPSVDEISELIQKLTENERRQLYARVFAKESPPGFWSVLDRAVVHVIGAGLVGGFSLMIFLASALFSFAILGDVLSNRPVVIENLIFVAIIISLSFLLAFASLKIYQDGQNKAAQS